MNLELWTSFSKKKNSTAHPSVGTGNTVFVKLKDNTSVMHPVFELVSNYAPSCKYAYVPDFGRFYFVEDIEYDTGSTWNLRLTCDPLASFMSVIGEYEGIINRCSDLTFYNPALKDELNPPTNIISISQRTDDLSGLFANETYVLTMASPAESYQGYDTKTGFCRSYVMDAHTLTQIAKKFLDINFIQDLANQFSNPMECVVGCKLLPITYSLIAGDSPVHENIWVGGWDLEASSDIVKNRYVTVNKNIDLPLKPNGAGSDNYVDNSPYTMVQAYLPFVGVVQLDYSAIRDTWKLNLRISIDVVTGDIIYYIYSDTAFNNLCATYSGNCASDCPVSSSTWDAKSYIGGAVAVLGGAAVAIGSLVTGGAAGAILGGLGALAGGVNTMQKSAETHTQINGAISSALGAKVHTSIIIEMFYNQPTHGLREGNYTQGLPCNKYGKVSSHAGYLIMNNPSIAINGTDAERDMINNYMSSGFYYE